MHVSAMILGLQLTRQIYLGTRDVTVDVHATGHYNHALGVDHGGAVGRRIDDLGVFDTNVPHLAVYAVNRIVDAPVDDPQ
jgi:hypothetical protein